MFQSGTGKLIRLSLSLAEGKFALGINALKLLLFIIDDFANYIDSENLEITDSLFDPRVIYVGNIDIYDAANVYETVRQAVEELKIAVIMFRDRSRKYIKTRWFHLIDYNRGCITYQFAPLINSRVAKLDGKDDRLYAGISPVLLLGFDTALALRLYLLAKVSFVRHMNYFSLSPWELADNILQQPSYYPKRPGYVGGTKYAIGNQKRLIINALKNINDASDMTITMQSSVNRKGAVHDWYFDFILNQSLHDSQIVYSCVAAGSEGRYPVNLSGSQLNLIQKEFPNNWENLINDLAEYQEIYGFIYSSPLWAIRKYVASGNPNHPKKLRKTAGYIDPPKVFYKGNPVGVSDQFYKNVMLKRSGRGD